MSLPTIGGPLYTFTLLMYTEEEIMMKIDFYTPRG
jgi:hypothetical protein